MTSAYEGGHIPQIEVRHRLRIAREYAGLEQDELAAAMGVSRNTVTNTEKGRSRPRRIVINAWALACGVPVSWLLTGENPPPPNGDGGSLLLPRMDSNHQPSDLSAFAQRKRRYGTLDPKTRQAA